VSEFETRLTYSWHSRIYCWDMLNVEPHRRVLGTYHHHGHCIIANSNSQSRWPTQWSSSSVRNETWAHLFVVKLQCVQEYNTHSGTPQIGIPECRELCHCLGIHGAAAHFIVGCIFAYDWSSDSTNICHPVENNVLWFPQGQLWQAATHYECLIPGQAHLNCNNMPPKCMFPTS
jgi:hypothetical protein